MNIHADKTQENKNRSVANEFSQKQSDGVSTFQFVDNRPEAIAQRKLQEVANNSAQVRQLIAFQGMANNSLQEKQPTQLSRGGRITPIIQRNAVKDEEGENYHDSNYPGVKMARQEGGYPYKYAILNPGQYQGAIVVDDDGDYYIPDGEGEADYDRPFNLQDVVLDDPTTAANIDQINIGQPGSGVVAGQGGSVTLRTSGLNSCVAWLLYNENAGYMEHILVGDPTKVKRDGISAQIAQIQVQFAQSVGSAATDLHIHVDASHPAYANTWPMWFKELIPSGLAVHSSMGAGNFSHEVPVSVSERTLWKCGKISLQYEK